ncbi:hypothetical protein BDN72DRAFT_832572 [Pluteus cervinus]|uniref:Uncharacterized protein n=1 Tax=Pluteus cervinus TaxID=181527 RepID=A0ACD3BAP3_9AGAR|nr:hypothetical protein BDN72DRAFT_832572 [Pluteus cervinus]
MTGTIEPLTLDPELRAHDAFFYGTLMHPVILKRVIHNEGLHLSICPAVLLEHTRHKVQRQDYPGVVPYSRGKTLFERDLELEERCVRGTLVVGLTEADLRYLDMFEGSVRKATRAFRMTSASRQVAMRQEKCHYMPLILFVLCRSTHENE